MDTEIEIDLSETDIVDSTKEFEVELERDYDLLAMAIAEEVARKSTPAWLENGQKITAIERLATRVKAVIRQYCEELAWDIHRSQNFSPRPFEATYRRDESLTLAVECGVSADLVQHTVNRLLSFKALPIVGEIYRQVFILNEHQPVGTVVAPTCTDLLMPNRQTIELWAGAIKTI
ncbi:hypothetical protein A3C96_02770 [Candidatus Uhrbacteria bacterium RIFCSPHIGHO2_02_FULL_60_10]|uniref:Uncharacterized protein n=1 Tax=Candidatus Uhrbacteria bacterium RIFCSPHIGHO2_02_FULL_60_10 TaxID=1802392 RepID=A0A1F7U9H0_9BACT|nr:MAG: hypothetical protein A3C96_02770 [Candidatus Uhrbacteria bacterium RIFCSPHIGHO2_02_FULL_60_10]